MPTSAPYGNYETLSGNPNAGPETVTNLNSAGSNNTITTPSSLTVATGDIVTWDLFGDPFQYTGYTDPNGNGIFLDTNNFTYYDLTNTPNGTGYAPVAQSTTTLACFAAGTRILTASGELPVESLVVGDLVPTLVGRSLAPIRWIGHSALDCSRHPRPWDVNPIRIAAGAFGDNLPLRDLTLSPDHAVFVNGVLVPVRYLVNHATIRQEEAGEITYWHVELDRHDALFAEGLPTESYLDTGNRHAFAGGGTRPLHPDFRPADREAWARAACARLVESGPEIAAIRDRLASRAATLGIPLETTLSVELAAVGRTEVVVPRGLRRVALVSPCLVPSGESRRLGACISQVELDGVALPLAAPALAAGFHAIETTQGRSWRWTNGEALLELPRCERSRLLTLDVRLCVSPEVAQAA